MGRIKNVKGTQGNRINTHPASDIPAQQRPPVFCFQYQRIGWTIADCADEFKIQLADAIHRRSSMTWAQIEVAPHEGAGAEKIPFKQIHPDIPSCFPKEEDKALVFRCGTNLMRLAGFRDQRIFHVVWVDPEGRLYDHGK